GAGKAGHVVAWSRVTHRRMWNTAVGKHLNDVGPLPAKPVTVCPNLLGGVETPMAYADNRLFVPVVDLCGIGGATTARPVTDLDQAFSTEQAGFDLHVDHRAGDDFRVVQLSPPGSACAIAIGTGISDMTPGSLKGLHLMVTDIVAARDELAARGVDVVNLRHT